MKILILSKDDMQKVMNMKEAINAVKEAASEYSKGNADIPLRANLNVKEYNGDSLYMYGYVKGSKALGVKLVSVYPDNPKKGVSSCPATVVLENAETGEVKCIMDGTYLTQLRTGALSGAATDYLARKDAHIYAQIGVGGQAEQQLNAILAVRDIKEVYIFSKSIDTAKQFCEEMTKKLSSSLKGLSYVTKEIPIFIPCEPRSEDISKADIITAVTVANNPVFDGNIVKKGCHINGVGSYTPEMSEIPSEVICKASKIIVDTVDGTINETGDFLKLIKKGLFKKEMITGELGDLVDGRCKGRENDEEFTFFETTGSAVFDLVTGEAIYQKAIKEGIGKMIEC